MSSRFCPRASRRDLARSLLLLLPRPRDSSSSSGSYRNTRLEDQQEHAQKQRETKAPEKDRKNPLRDSVVKDLRHTVVEVRSAFWNIPTTPRGNSPADHQELWWAVSTSGWAVPWPSTPLRCGGSISTWSIRTSVIELIDTKDVSDRARERSGQISSAAPCSIK